MKFHSSVLAAFACYLAPLAKPSKQDHRKLSSVMKARRSARQIITDFLSQRTGALMSVNTKKLLIGALLSVLTMPHASAAMTKGLVSVMSEMSQFLFEELEKIPSMPTPLVSANEYPPCEMGSAEGQHAKRIEEQGWATLSEAALEQFHLVTFAGTLTRGTSGMCRISNSFVGVFENEQFIGVIRTEDEQNTEIGGMGAIQDGVIRLSSGEFISSPVADIRVIDDTLIFGPVSEFTSHCGGQTAVPNVIGQSIIAGREVLFRNGFRPAKTSPGDWGTEARLQANGISEVDGCSGGPAYCMFRYEDDYSRVSVVTQGEQAFPNVVRFWVDCKTE